MHGETQANRLAELMQHKGNLPSYELALDLVAMRSSSLEKLDTNSILVLELNDLECILIENNVICARVSLVKISNRYAIKILKLKKEVILDNSSKKYETLKLLFGEIRSRTLSVGHTIDVTQVDFEKVDLIHKEKKIATGLLISVDEKICVKIDKVENNE